MTTYFDEFDDGDEAEDSDCLGITCEAIDGPYVSPGYVVADTFEEYQGYLKKILGPDQTIEFEHAEDVFEGGDRILLAVTQPYSGAANCELSESNDDEDGIEFSIKLNAFDLESPMTTDDFDDSADKETQHQFIALYVVPPEIDDITVTVTPGRGVSGESDILGPMVFRASRASDNLARADAMEILKALPRPQFLN